jgi:hypothetical protein
MTGSAAAPANPEKPQVIEPAAAEQVPNPA